MNQIKISNLNLNELNAEKILNRIKDMSVQGSDYRGHPKSLEIKDIVRYTNKQGKCIYEGPDKLENNSEYLSDLVNANGVLSKENLGKIYWLSTTQQNNSMSDSVTGTSTSFKYRTFNNGSEDLYLDSIPFGYTDTFGKEDKKPTKINNSSIANIVREINPQSKLI